MRILSVDEMRRVEAAADESGRSYAEMMERAGQGVARAILARRDVKDERVVILVGPGNNGGDGLVAARHLANAGAEVACYLLKPRDEDDPNLQAVTELELLVADATNDQRWRVLRQLVKDAHVIVDALLGTGTRLPLKGNVDQLLGQVKASIQARLADVAARRTLTTPARPGLGSAVSAPPLIVAVDGPSGLDYDTGELDHHALSADLTVTFAYPKRGHFLYPGAVSCGELVVADIGVDPKVTLEILGDPHVQVATAEMVGSLLPNRPADAHKGTFGRALLVAGSINYTGAAYLAASAATRVGAGLVTLAIPAAIHGPIAAKISEATYLILPQAMGIIAPDATKLLLEKADDYDALLIGPGLTQEKEAVEFVQTFFKTETGPKRKARIGFQASGGAEEAESEEKSSRLPPLVVDADGLNALAAMEDNWWEHVPPPSVLTPHPGEMARLLNGTIGDVQSDRVGVAEEMAKRWGHVIVLKGASTVVANPEGPVVVLPFATPALASAGTGDVLAGAVVGLLAQGLKPFDAALAGAYLHGLAGTWAGEEIGLTGPVASDLLPRLPKAVRTVRMAAGGG